MAVKLTPKGLSLNSRKVKIPNGKRNVKALVLTPLDPKPNAAGVLYIHGGGHVTGMKEMVYMSRAVDMVERYGAIVIAPGYRLAWTAPYPEGLTDCYATLLWMRDHAEELGINPSQLMVSGESAGGGLAIATCLLARDRNEVNIAYQMPIYPMIDNLDTDSSRDNHNKVWDTKKNHLAWKLYLRKSARFEDASPYAAPARETNYTGLPPAYSFVCTGDPFYKETISYIDALRDAGVHAEIDVYEGFYHAFDLFEDDAPETKLAIERCNQHFEWALENCFADQPILSDNSSNTI